MSKGNFYIRKDTNYFGHVRWELIDIISNNICERAKILDVGCGVGATSKELKKMGLADELIGIEIDESAAKSAREFFDQVIIGDVESVLPKLKKNHFDLIILGDVLEHLIDPWSALKKITCCLKDNGYIVASIPNIRYIKVSLPLLLFDKFEYTNAGILDMGHLRFFTKTSMKKMFKSANLEIIEINPHSGKRALMLNKLTGRVFESFLAGQYILKARKNIL